MLRYKQMNPYKRYKYRIKEAATNPLDSLIEKTGKEDVKVAFSINGMKADIDAYQRRIRELEGKMELEAAMVDNVRTHHPEVFKLDEKTLIAAAVYQLSSKKVKLCMDEIMNYKSALDSHTKELQEITNQTKIELEPKPEPIKPDIKPTEEVVGPELVEPKSC